jgi:phage shock protein E
MGNTEIPPGVDENTPIIDVRTPGEHAIHRHPRAINIPLSDISTSNALPQDKEKPVIVHCMSGHRSEQAAQILRQKGYKKVINAGTVFNVMNFK